MRTFLATDEMITREKPPAPELAPKAPVPSVETGKIMPVKLQEHAGQFSIKDECETGV